jgi:hypothetical protein
MLPSFFLSYALRNSDLHTSYGTVWGLVVILLGREVGYEIKKRFV